MALSAIALPATLAGAEAYVNKSLIYVDNSDFTEISSGVSGLPITVDGKPWNRKGSAGLMAETFMTDEDGTNYCNIMSDSMKNGVAGEGSYYFYNKNEKTGMEDKGYVKFDIRMNEGSGPMELNLGQFTDPTKGVSPAAAQLFFDPEVKKITATTSGGKKEDILDNFTTGTWYTVELELNIKPLEEYTVTVYDKDGKKLGSAEELAFIEKNITMIQTTAFSYVRKNVNGLDFDLKKVTIARMDKESVEATQAASAAEATPAPTETPAPSATPTPTAEPQPSAAPSTTPAPATPTPAPVTVTFPDITSHWAKSEIEAMASAGIINGMDDGTFQPDAQITRAQFIKLVVAALKLDVSGEYNGLANDLTGHWVAPYVNAAEAEGLLAEAFFENDQLKPDQNITREEMASIVAHAAMYEGISVDTTADTTFTDSASIAEWAADDVVSAANLGIITGYEDHSFKPQNLSKRGEAAVMMNRLFQHINAMNAADQADDPEANGSEDTTPNETSGGNAEPAQ